MSSFGIGALNPIEEEDTPGQARAPISAIRARERLDNGEIV
jgi:hypothetical protein